VKRQQPRALQAAQKHGNATKSSAYSVKLAACFNWISPKWHKRIPSGRFYLAPKVLFTRSLEQGPRNSIVVEGKTLKARFND